MKPTKYMMATVAVLGFLMATHAQADRGRGRPGGPGHYTHVVPTPRFHVRSHIFVPLFRPPHMTRHILTVPSPRPIILPAPAPVIIPQPTVTVWITNANGSRSPVVLKIDGPWYIGPRGERYVSMPSEDQLRSLYGLDCGPVELEKVSVYITTDSGALRLITLTRTAAGFVGPNGELYGQMPTNEQLRMAYGR